MARSGSTAPPASAAARSTTRSRSPTSMSPIRSSRPSVRVDARVHGVRVEHLHPARYAVERPPWYGGGVVVDEQVRTEGFDLPRGGLRGGGPNVEAGAVAVDREGYGLAVHAGREGYEHAGHVHGCTTPGPHDGRQGRKMGRRVQGPRSDGACPQGGVIHAGVLSGSGRKVDRAGVERSSENCPSTNSG